MINTIPGGIMGLTIEEAAVTAAEKFFEYPLFSISGTKILHCIAASAFAEPEILPSTHSTKY